MPPSSTSSREQRTDPTFSVVVPTYERRELVVEAVESVLRQTYPSFEVVVVDDGSTDGTAEALEALPGPIRCIRQENRGVAAARNTGLAAARGRIVAFLDSDNLWLPDHLETIRRSLEQFPEAVLAGTSPHFQEIPSDGARLIAPLPRQLFNPCVRFLSTIAVRAEILAAVGGFDETLPTSEDGDLVLRISRLGPFAITRRRTVRIRATRGSFWHRSRASGAFLEADELMIRKFLEAAEGPPAMDPQVMQVARGRLSLNKAYRGIASGDTALVQATLADACSAIPELSSNPESIVRRLSVLVPGTGAAHELARTYALAADAWPDPACDSALVLRSSAVLAALRAGELRYALRQARRLPLERTARLAFRQRRLFARVAEERVRLLLFSGAEAPAVSRRIIGGTKPDTLKSWRLPPTG